MDTLFLNAHTVRQSLTFRVLKTERSGQLALLVGKNTLEERMLTWKQPGGIQIIARKMRGICAIIQQGEYTEHAGHTQSGPNGGLRARSF